MRRFRPTTEEHGPGNRRRTASADARSRVDDLATIPMFAPCRPEQLRRIDRLMCERRVPAGQVLLREGRIADQMILIISGRAGVSQDGTTLGFAERGACFGARELRARAMVPVTVTAQTPVTVRAATARDLSSLLEAAPAVEFLGDPGATRVRRSPELEAVLFADVAGSTGHLRMLVEGASRSALPSNDLVGHEVTR